MIFNFDLSRALFVAASIFAAVLSNSARADGNGTSDFFLSSGSGHLQGPFVGAVNANNVVGAPRFYNAGFTGTNAVIANVEAGYAWNGHETLSHVTMIPASAGSAGETDRHATWVSMVLAGRPVGPNSGDHQRGMAPNAQLASGAIATNWPNSLSRYTGSFNFNFSAISTFGPYRAAFLTGVPVAGGSRTADVVNSSYNGNGDFAGANALSGTLDALINQNPRTLLVTAVGNTPPRGLRSVEVLPRRCS